MRKWWLKKKYKVKYHHKYSSVDLYYGMNCWKPIRYKRSLFIPVRWFAADISDCIKNPEILKLLREALSYKP